MSDATAAAAGDPAVTGGDGARASLPEAANVKLSFPVVGMTCAACVSRVQRALTDTGGVRERDRFAVVAAARGRHATAMEPAYRATRPRPAFRPVRVGVQHVAMASRVAVRARHATPPRGNA